MLDVYEFCGTVLKKTRKSALIEFDDGTEFWFPFSCTTDVEEHRVGDEVFFLVMKWFVDENFSELESNIQD